MKIEKIGPHMLILGDSTEVLKELEQVHAVVTDPPYHLTSIVKRFGSPNAAPAKFGTDGAFARASKGFMNQSWDGGDIAFQPEFWELVRDAMLPGAHLLAFSGSRTYHRMACGIEDAGFEIRDQIMWLYGCLSSDTECLTREGWKSYLEVTTATDVMQWDHVSGSLSWVKPSKVHEYDFDGEMINLKNRNTDQLLTPNHRVYAKVRRHSRYEEPTSYEVIEADVLHNRSSAWQVDLPLAGILDEGEAVDPKYAYIMGWWLTDAWKHGDGKAIMFSQSKTATLEKLRKALEPFNPSEYTKPPRKDTHATEHTFYVTGEIADRLKNDAPDRKLDWKVLDWDKSARQALYEGLMDGDGSRKEGQYAHAFWSKDQERRDVFMALALSLDYRVYDYPSKHCVNVNVECDTTQIQNKHRANKVPYIGKVWCLTVPTGAFVVRRNGKAFITGNSGFPKSHDVSKNISKSYGIGLCTCGVPETLNSVGGDHDNGEIEERSIGNGFICPKCNNLRRDIGHSALKPAHEPVCMARKPLIGTNVENVLEHGTGALNIEGCRVGYEVLQEHKAGQAKLGTFERSNMITPERIGRYPANVIHDGSDEVLEGFPETPPAKSGRRGERTSTGTYEGWVRESHKGFNTIRGYDDNGGSAARFFKQSNFSDEEWLEKNLPQLNVNIVNGHLSLQNALEGIAQEVVVNWDLPEEMRLSVCPVLSTNVTATELKIICENFIPPMISLGKRCLQDWQQERLSLSDSPVSVVVTRNQTGTMTITVSHWRSDGSADPVTFNITGTNLDHGGQDLSRAYYCAKASKKDRGEGNVHPTVKPNDLMRYLCRLVTPPNGIILDPFMGSGSTGIAAIQEGFRFIGIEREEKYFDIALKRIKEAYEESQNKPNTLRQYINRIDDMENN